MASRIAIASMLAYLHELYPSRTINAATPEAFAFAFADWSDDELQSAAMQAATKPGRTFFPTPGEIAECRKVAPIVDGAALLRRIESLGSYSAAVGFIAPQVFTVRKRLGDLIADAYATAGGVRCFSDDPITRSIAFREFQKAVTEYAALPAEQRPLIESGEQPRKLSRGGEPIGNIIQRALLAPADGDAA